MILWSSRMLRRKLLCTAVIALVLSITPGVAAQRADAFNPVEEATYSACFNFPDERQFTTIKIYNRGTWYDDWFPDPVRLYCGHNIGSDTDPRHGYTHIRIDHTNTPDPILRGDWQYETNQVKFVIPETGPNKWQDLLDIVLARAMADYRPAKVSEDGECSNVAVEARNLATGGLYQFGAQVKIQKKKLIGGYFPEDAVGSAYPARVTCDGGVWPWELRKESRTAVPIVKITSKCDALGCQFIMDANNAIAFRRGSGAYYIGGPIRARWDAWRSSVGYPISAMKCGLVRGGCFQKFVSRSSYIYNTPTTGAHVVKGMIAEKWVALGSERTSGFLGYPTTDEKCGLVRRGCFSKFEGGYIHYSPATGAWSTKNGKILDAWIQTSSERGHWGYPVSDESHPSGSPANHRQQTFENGFFYFDGTTVTGEWGDPGCPSCKRQKVTFPGR